MGKQNKKEKKDGLEIKKIDSKLVKLKKKMKSLKKLKKAMSRKVKKKSNSILKSDTNNEDSKENPEAINVEESQQTDISTDVSPNAEKKGPQRFSRVKAEDANLIKNDKLKDNSYSGTFGGGGWGHKANEVLKYTRGKGFRHEKTKKKRGGYRGGQIDTNAVNSVKFD